MDAAVLASTSRGRLRGFRHGRTAVFLGIPFAQPPVGTLRFAAPVPVEPWEGERDATAYGPTAQRGDAGITLIPEPSVPGDATLNVNVFTPVDRDPDAALPVLVWIHGGGYTSGSPASRWYDGDAFARDGVVVVVISYRIGFDGFGLIDGAPSNRGLRDQIAALERVRDEIGAFGGDPARVTVAGQSAGGGSVLALMASPASSGLFHGAMAISPAIGAVAVDAARVFAARLASLAGVAADREGFVSVPEERLIELQKAAGKPPRGRALAALTALFDEGLVRSPRRRRGRRDRRRCPPSRPGRAAARRGGRVRPRRRPRVADVGCRTSTCASVRRSGIRPSRRGRRLRRGGAAGLTRASRAAGSGNGHDRGNMH